MRYSRWFVSALIVSLALWGFACGGVQAPESTKLMPQSLGDGEDGIPQGDGHGTVTPGGGEDADGGGDEVAEADPDAWRCGGELPPPIGFEQATAFVPLATPNAKQAAMDSAQARLVNRLCAGSTSCDALRARVVSWKTGEDAVQACAQAVIKRDDVEAWRKSAGSLGDFDAALRAAAKELLKDIRKPKLIIDKIIDDGAAGGSRAAWLSERFGKALQDEGGKTLALMDNWNGSGVPRGVDVVITARATSRMEQQRKVVEVVWKARIRSGRSFEIRRSKPVLFSADAAPRMTSPAAALPPLDPNLFVRIDSKQPGGSLCLGEKTHAWLHSKEKMHVRVFDLYGDDGAFLIFPNENRPDGVVKAGETLDLGAFEAVPAPGKDVERFLVIGGETPADLGRFSTYMNYCRAPRDVAQDLHKGAGLPTGARASSDSFRITADPMFCPNQPTERPDPTAALKQFPECR